MRSYGTISPQFWIGETGRYLRGHVEAQLIGAYLQTCPSSTSTGLYYLPISTIAHDLGMTIEGASKGLRRGIEGAFCSYDEVLEVVFVHRLAYFQVGKTLKSGDKRKKGILTALKGYEKSSLYLKFLEIYAEPYGLEELLISARDSSSEQGASKPLGSPFEGAHVTVPVPVTDPVTVSDPVSKSTLPPEAEELADLLADLILERDPKAKPKASSWIDAIDKLHRIDERGWSEIRDVIVWCQRDSFWCSNVLSGATLRKKFQTLRGQMMSRGRSNGNGAEGLDGDGLRALSDQLREAGH